MHEPQQEQDQAQAKAGEAVPHLPMYEPQQEQDQAQAKAGETVPHLLMHEPQQKQNQAQAKAGETVPHLPMHEPQQKQNQAQAKQPGIAWLQCGSKRPHAVRRNKSEDWSRNGQQQLYSGCTCCACSAGKAV
eukprot:1158780-Pelagomonas_calceolata.AAC.16